MEGFEDSIRYGIAAQIADLHRTVHPEILAAWLGVPDAKLQGWVKAFGWKLEDGVISLPGKHVAPQTRIQPEIIQIKGQSCGGILAASTRGSANSCESDFTKVIRRAYEQQV